MLLKMMATMARRMLMLILIVVMMIMVVVLMLTVTFVSVPVPGPKFENSPQSAIEPSQAPLTEMQKPLDLKLQHLHCQY